ncbi:MAG: hypothetical protein JNM94_09770 [Phycisphaerae bacterium]|nr:hypothetical protein [Phycisphaerae bacterium]
MPHRRSTTTASHGRARGSKRSFIRQYLKHPTQIGAIAPSSPYLAEAMLAGFEPTRMRVVAEFGPGSGAFTRAILDRVRPETRFLPIELNPRMAEIFRTRFPSVRLHERSAADLPAICREEGLGEAPCVDFIVSGLPWAAFPIDLQRAILDGATAAMRPGASFVTFAYNLGLLTAAGRRFAKLLPNYFSKVERSRTVWRNVPPAFVYRCVR